MVDEEQAERLVKLKRLLDSGAITQKEFEDMKKSILAESTTSAVLPMRTVQPKELRLFGVLGFVALVIPWNVLTWGTDVFGIAGAAVEWHFFSFSFFAGFSNFYTILARGLQFQIVDSIGFILVLAGSILLLFRRRLGGTLLIGSLVAWIIHYAFLLQIASYVNIPIGALMVVVVGIASLVYKRGFWS